MKGLLLKDLYIIMKYCRFYLLAVVVITLVSMFYPEMSTGLSIALSIMAVTLSMTTMAYDERSKWTEYCGTLPYSKAQVVSSKYIMSLLGEAAVILFSLILQLTVTGTENILLYLAVWGAVFLIGCVFTAIIMPFMFRLGTEKARIALIISFVIFSSIIIALYPDGMTATGTETIVIPPALFIALPAAAVALYILSWYLSIIIYEKREI